MELVIFLLQTFAKQSLYNNEKKLSAIPDTFVTQFQQVYYIIRLKIVSLHSKKRKCYVSSPGNVIIN